MANKSTETYWLLHYLYDASRRKDKYSNSQWMCRQYHSLEQLKDSLAKYYSDYLESEIKIEKRVIVITRSFLNRGEIND